MNCQAPLPRRALLALAAAGLLPGCATPPLAPARPEPAAPATPAAWPATRPTDLAATHHWVNRLTWGANDTDMAQALALGRPAWLRAQLSPQRPAELPAAVQAQIDALDIQRRPLEERWQTLESLRQAGVSATSEDERKAARQAFQRELQRLRNETAHRHLLRALYSPAQLHEQMSWFWFNHFNVHQAKHQVRLWLADYEDHALRPHALGSFRALLGAATRHPAMLQYLDNAQNAARRLNENHARELLELHTLGVDGGYSQKDVQELARVLTGHGVANARRAGAADARGALQAGFYVFSPARHDMGDKQVLGRAIRGRGADELDEVLDALVAHPATAHFISRKIARFLLGDHPSDALVQAMAGSFQKTQGQIGPVIQTLVDSPEFAAAAGTPAQFKDPMHHVLGALRLAHGNGAVLLSTEAVQAWLNQLGQGLYNRATPDGYPPQAEAWNSSGQLAARFDIARAIGAGRAELLRVASAAPARPRDNTPPPLAQSMLVQQVLLPALRPASRSALDAAKSNADWNALLLASPEFMFR
ncbi:hypothetical protein BurJ1DRAFT_4595 [Burkholderiales bacterium JOSHI_001]|nr:hypothetical protein BurJ1DRAFT_4595 [Burkholderiales bacterium JOSHI_001]